MQLDHLTDISDLPSQDRQHSPLFDLSCGELEIVDHLARLLVHPTGECDENELQRSRELDHGTQATRGES
jgi:hypothetical protein